jgi:hypothetical protein
LFLKTIKYARSGLLGLLVFGELPDGYAMLGLMLIAISGFGSLFIHHRQARHV